MIEFYDKTLTDSYEFDIDVKRSNQISKVQRLGEAADASVMVDDRNITKAIIDLDLELRDLTVAQNFWRFFDETADGQKDWFLFKKYPCDRDDSGIIPGMSWYVKTTGLITGSLAIGDNVYYGAVSGIEGEITFVYDHVTDGYLRIKPIDWTKTFTAGDEIRKTGGGGNVTSATLDSGFYPVRFWKVDKDVMQMINDRSVKIQLRVEIE